MPRLVAHAGRALGLNSTQVMLYIVLPQATRIVIPALGNSVNGLLNAPRPIAPITRA